MKYYVIAGEASGDLHGSNLMRAMKEQDPHARFRIWGGDMMEAAGGTLVKHYRDLAFMGFVEVLMNLRTIFKNLAFCKEDIEAYQPDALILVDYPGFNLRIAEWAKQKGIKVIYYISPQVWAWKENRVVKMKQHIDLMLVILPFEKPYYEEKWKWPVYYVGHPLVEVIDKAKATDLSFNPVTNNTNWASAAKTVALLPGSRKQEILKKLPVMLSVTKDFPECMFFVAKAPGLDAAFYDEMLASYPNVGYVNNQTYALLKRSDAALVTSGTATLETALFSVPEVVCYIGSPISYAIAKRIIKIKYISLVNLIMDQLVVKELIQHELTTDALRMELKALLYQDNKRAQLKKDYTELYEVLSMGGKASQNAAKEIASFLKINAS
ncbi:MAG: lipid-A-disaccharide synthase [Chitinophagaceae bacterium]|nr:lipid-A-disaccharide synthase [Chitinophagaceae bacterium]